MTTEEDFYADVADHSMAALWLVMRSIVPSRPRTAAVAHRWAYADVSRLLLTSGDVVSVDEADRRAIVLVNPGITDRASSSNTLQAAMQAVMPGEEATAHRHSMTAFRLMVEGSGAVTVVDGQPSLMAPGDLVLTPSWTWHDHVNESDGPAIWLDGLDQPLIAYLGVNFFEPYDGRMQTRQEHVDPDSCALGRGVRAVAEWTAPPASVPSRLRRYPWEDVRVALDEASARELRTPADDVLLEYVDPSTGSSAMPTIACFVQRLTARRATAAHRHTSAAMYHVIEGSGTTVVDGNPIEWTTHDTFFVPAWAVHHHEADGADAVLFSYSDAPVMRSLGLHREEAAASG